MPRKGTLTLANALTLARLLLLPVILTGIVRNLGYITVGAMAVVIVTDLLDGRIARRMRQSSEFGGTLDSTVDFVLIYSLFIAFYAAGRLPAYQFAFIYVAMLTTFMLQLWSMANADVAAVMKTRLGRMTGAFQYMYLLILVAREVLPETRAVVTFSTVMFIHLAVATVLSSVGAMLKLRRLV